MQKNTDFFKPNKINSFIWNINIKSYQLLCDLMFYFLWLFNMQDFFDEIGVKIPEVYLPKKWTDLRKWSVVACDQYTSQPEYWNEVKSIVGDNPSTLKITFPEIYLEWWHKEEIINNITKTMHDYEENWVLENQWAGFIYLERNTSNAPVRKGLILALDLEKYDFSKGSQTLIRATEWTIIERIPPRVEIRKNAIFELPHIMVLIDDPEKQVIEPLKARVKDEKLLYDFDLMMNWWHIKWWKIDDEETIMQIINWLKKLNNVESFKEKYWLIEDLWVLLFAMWDWNHSFATAKAIREEKKKTLSPEEQLNDPARFALVEINNVRDEWIVFEPIHRVLFNVEENSFMDEMWKFFRSIWSDLKIENYNTKEEVIQNMKKSDSNMHYCWWVSKSGYYIFGIQNPKLNLEVWNVQAFLDQYLKDHTDSKIDYVHGDDVVEKLWKENWNFWILFPIMDKADFFKTVVIDGALPRKTFSMWEANEKRYYLEARKIVK